MFNNQQWLNDRTKGIGGSDASIILGINPWKSVLELWNEKVNGTSIEIDTPDFRWGKILEPVIANEYGIQTNRAVAIYNRNIVSKEYSFMRANLDRIIIDPYRKTKTIGVLEIKTKGAFVKWEGDIPDYYQAQLQHYLAVTGYEYGAFAVLDLGKKKLLTYDVERDDKFIRELIEKEKEFWNLVVNRIPPEIDESEACNKYLKDTYKKEEKGKQIDLTLSTDANIIAELLHDTREKIKYLKNSEILYKNQLMSIMKDAEIAIGDKYKIIWKSPKDKIEFDLENFMNDYPELAEKYMKSMQQARRFNFRYDEK